MSHPSSSQDAERNIVAAVTGQGTYSCGCRPGDCLHTRSPWPSSEELAAFRAELRAGLRHVPPLAGGDTCLVVLPEPDGQPYPHGAGEPFGFGGVSLIAADAGAWWSWLIAAARADRALRLDRAAIAAGQVPESWTCPAADAEHWPATLSAGIVECGNCGCFSDALTGERLP